ncbi:MAG: hypothetical protein ACK4K0_05140 [Flavobacteriales bacterium]
MLRLAVFTLFILQGFVGHSQAQLDSLNKSLSGTKRGDVAILELRLNAEDEFRTIDGSDVQGLARIAFFVVDKKGIVLSKGFKGFHEVTGLLTVLNDKGWELQDTYSLKTQSLMITHYVLKKIKR